MTDHDMNHRDYDFGSDADVVPPSEPEFDAWIAGVAPTLNSPSRVPRLEMWQAIQRMQRTAGARGARTSDTTRRRPPWGLLSAVAAALLLGAAIDRVMLRGTERERQPVGAGTSASNSVEPADPVRLYRMAAAQTLTQADALLTAYRASGMPGRSPLDDVQLGKWGREVLSSTRLLIDSPAGDDPMLRALLTDLELVLVQVIQISGTPLDSTDRDLIDHVLQERDLLPRIRTAVPAGITGSASAD